MIVTRSCLHAVRYKLAVDRYLAFPVYTEADVNAFAKVNFDPKGVTHAILKTIAAFLSTEGGDLLIGVADGGSIVGIEADRLESDDKFMRHLAQVVQSKRVCVVSCRRSPEPVFLKWKGMEAAPDGDFYVRSGPGTVKLPPESARVHIRTRFGRRGGGRESYPPSNGDV